ncbi:sensor histidine kinase [Promicromonospora sp. NPDC057488]|uniref:sensor histidine kinase n=1 Tax=Promicromonospora sp. NPDC057488 TaxID=3346147 RepID=UPI003670CB0B
MGWYERWAGWSERYRFVVDLVITVLAVLVVAVTAGDSAPYYLSATKAALISAAVVAPLAWCRTRPVASCVAVFVVCMVQLIAFRVPVLVPADLAVLVSMYCITVYGPRWAYLMACGMAVVGPLTVGAVMWFQYQGSDYSPDFGPIAGTVVVIVTFLACSFAFGLVRRSRRSMLVAMRDRAERLEIERDQQAQISTAAERARIAREMHDIVAHSLSVVIAQADGGRYAAAADPAAAERALGTIAETGRAALADMRRLLGVLREGPDRGSTPLGLVAPAGVARARPRPTTGSTPAAPDAGGARPATPSPADGAAPLRPQPDVTNLRDLVDQARDDGLRVSWARVGVERRLPPGVGLTLFRVCQEALTNVRKHAGPRPAVTMLLCWGEEEVELRVDDDGRGLAAAGSADPAEQPSAGYGLLGMRERAEMFGGTLTAGPRRGGGFSVRFVVPIPRAERPATAGTLEPAEPAAAGPATTEPSTTTEENDD